MTLFAQKKRDAAGKVASAAALDTPENVIRINPEFKSIIPPLNDDEREQLEANLLNEGCRDPLVIWNGILLDGHNRYHICQKHGLEFKTVQASTVLSFDQAILWVIKNQLGRRNLTDFARGELALRAKPIVEKLARLRQEASQIRNGCAVAQKSAEPAIETREILAKAAGVSHDTIRKIEKIRATASPEIVEAARAGEISINAAAKVAALPAAAQADLVTEGPAAIKRTQAKSGTAAQSNTDSQSTKLANENEALRKENSELRHRVAELQDSLSETLADNEMMGRVFDAEDQLKAAVDEAARQKAIADNARRSLAAKAGEFSERARAVVYWKNRAEKAEQALRKVGI